MLGILLRRTSQKTNTLVSFPELSAKMYVKVRVKTECSQQQSSLYFKNVGVIHMCMDINTFLFFMQILTPY